MPKSRSSRSKSPQKPLTAAELKVQSEREEIYQNVQEMFKETVDSEVIYMVLTECEWKGEDAIDRLLMIGNNSEIQRQYKKKSQLQQIAEGVFGSLRSEEYPVLGSQHSSNSSSLQSSPLSQKDKVIQRPQRTAASGHKTAPIDTGLYESDLQGTTQLHVPLGHLSSRGADSQDTRQDQDSFVDDIELDLHFPRLPLRKPASSRSSGSSPIGSHRSHSGQVQTGSQPDLITEAQTAYQQQYDDAAGAQRWEQYKDKLSEHYAKSLVGGRSSESLVGSTYRKGSPVLKPSSTADGSMVTASVLGDPAILQAQKERPKSETSRSFPVRLLSRSPDEDSPEFSEGNTCESNDVSRLDSADLDETVLKCIYEVHDDLLDQAVLAESALRKRSSSGRISDLESERLSAGTPEGSGHATPTPSNQPMTLPVIGLSANAAEFIPRPKAINPEKPESSKDTVNKEPGKPVRSNSIEIKSGTKNIRMNSPTVQAAASISPLTISPAQSPVVSPPSSHIGSPATNLTGSPMFITPKWQPLFPRIATPPPPIRPPVSALPATGTRFITPPPPHHLPPPQYRLPATHIPFSTRMVYPMAQTPPVFHVSGINPHMQPLQSPLSPRPIGCTMEERALIATGQPIMATSEIGRHLPPTPVTNIPGLPVKLVNQAFINKNMQKIRELHQAGRKVLVIIRGLPGSGKSMLSRALKQDGVVLSTDDYFMKGDMYEYNPEKLAESHQWNRERAKEALKMGTSPIVIDNTNTQKWEFKPYVSMAHNHSYHVEIMEPETPWKTNPKELARRTVHGVPKDQIQRMLERYEQNITVEMVTMKKKIPAQTSKKSSPAMSSQEDNQNRAMKTSSSTRTASSGDSKDKTVDSSTVAVNVKADGIEDWDMHPDGESMWSDSPRNFGNRASSLDKDSDCVHESKFMSDRSSKSSKVRSLNSDGPIHGQSSSIKSKKPGLHGLTSRPRSIEKPDKLPRFVPEPSKEEWKIPLSVKIDTCLSEETVKVVEELVGEHVNDTNLSKDDLSRVEAELKALLQLYPMDEKERGAAETLICQKLHGNPVNDNEDADILQVDDHDIIETGHSREPYYMETSVPEELQHIAGDMEVVDSDNTEQQHNANQLDAQIVHDMFQEKDTIDLSVPYLLVESDRSQGVNHVDIVHNTLDNSKLISDSADNDQIVMQNVYNVTSTTDIESQYWSQNSASVETQETVEHIEAVWDDTKDVDTSWSGENLTSFENSQPQRPRKARHNSNSSRNKEDANTDKQATTERGEDGAKDRVEHESQECKHDHDKSDSSNITSEEQCSEEFLSCVENSLNSSNNSALEDLQHSENFEKLNSDTELSEAKMKSSDVCDSVEGTGAGNLGEIMPDISDSVDEMPDITENESEINEECVRLIEHVAGESEKINVDNTLKASEIGKCDDTDVLTDQVEGNNDAVKLNVPDIMVSKPCLTVSENSSLSLLKDSYSDSGIDQETSTEKHQEIFIDNIDKKLKLDTNVTECKAQDLDSSFGEEESRSLTEGQVSNIETAQEVPNGVEVNDDLNARRDSSPKTGPEKRKKPSRKKMAANFTGPFFEEKDKESFLTGNWGKFPITYDHLTLPGNTQLVDNTVDISKKNHKETMTSQDDFTILNTLCNGGFVDSSVVYIISKRKQLVSLDCDIVKDENDERSINEKFTIHQSTSTDDLKVEDSESIAFLKTCFPDLKPGELECVLVNCDNNIEWTIEMMLDWKYTSDLTEEEKEDFVNRLGNITKMQASQRSKVDLLNDMKQPKLLRDISFEFIVKKKIVSKEELELQLIQTGKERLDRIEDENLTKIRLRRSSSMSDTSPSGHKRSLGGVSPTALRSNSAPHGSQCLREDNTLDMGNKSKLSKEGADDVVFEEIKSHLKHTENDSNEARLELDTVRLNDIETRADKTNANKISDSEYEFRCLSETELKETETEEAVENDVDWLGEDSFEKGGESALIMEFDLHLVRQLEEVFGPVGYPGSAVGSLNVRVDYQTAWNLYQRLKVSLAERSKKVLQQLAEDEKLAKQLQEEEDSFNASGMSGTSARGRRAPALVGVSGSGPRVPVAQRPALPHRPVRSLVEIMEEEARIQSKQDQFKKLIEHEGGHQALATRMKRQKLYEVYPHLDRTMLDEVFQNCCFNLEKTVEHIEFHIGDSTLTSDVPDSFTTDKELLEAMKRQSVQDKLDMYLYTPAVSKDYQDGADPEYEDFRGEANLHHRLRHECFQKAQEAYRQGLKQVASFYSQQGHLHTQKIKEANMRASELILEERNSELEKHQTLDLHGLHVEEAIEALNRILPQKQKEQKKGQITVITGRGSHSRGGVARLRPRVIAYLKQQQYTFSETQPGVIKVLLRSRKQ